MVPLAWYIGISPLLGALLSLSVLISVLSVGMHGTLEAHWHIVAPWSAAIAFGSDLGTLGWHGTLAMARWHIAALCHFAFGFLSISQKCMLSFWAANLLHTHVSSKKIVEITAKFGGK